MKIVTTHYRWPGNSQIDHVAAEHGEDGRVTLHIHGNESLATGSLSKLPGELRRYGFQNQSTTVEDKLNMLLVSGLKEKDVGRVLDLLSKKSFVAGVPNVDSEVHVTKEGMLERIQNDSLRYSGWAGIPGHIALIARGSLMGGMSLAQAGQGAMGLAVPSILAVGGNGAGEQNFDPLINQMREYFRKEGVPFPADDQPVLSEEHRESFLDVAKHIVLAHPVPISYGLGGIAAWLGIKGALAEGNAFRAAASGVSLAGDFVAVGVPENKDQDDRSPIQKLIFECRNIGKACLKPKTLPHAVATFAKNGPVALMGMINLADNVLFGKGWYDEYKTFKKVNGDPAGHTQNMAEKENRLFDIKRTAFGEDAAKKIKEATTLEKEIAQMEKEFKISTGGGQWRGRTALVLTGITTVTWAFSSALAAISSKNANKKQRDESLDRLYSAMAKLIVEFPNEDRQTTLNLMGGYLSSQPALQHLHLTSEALVSEISKRVETMQYSPFVAALAQQSRNTAASSVTSIG